MLSERQKILLIPVEVTEFIYENGLIKPFSIFLYLKLFAGNKVSATDEVFAKLRQDLKMSDPKGRTFNKHFQQLLELNWIGYNAESGIYHIRSFAYIRAINGFKKRRATKLFLKDILQLQVYLVGVLLCTQVYAQKYYWEIAKGRSGTATNKRDVAKQSRASRRSSKPPYYGICNKRIAKLLCCKYTRACNLKKAAAKAGYITLRKHYADLKELDKADYNMRPIIAERRPELAKRMRFWRQIKNGNKMVKVVQQLHDEIIPNIEFKKIASFASLKVPFGIIKSFLPNQSHAKAA
jgi:hypothetical protein